MDNTSLAIVLNDRRSHNPDHSNRFRFHSLFGRPVSGEVGFIQFVVTCLLIAIGLPLTLGAIYGLYSQVRKGEVAPIYVINLLVSDLVQFCCFIVEVAQPGNLLLFSEYSEIFDVFIYIYEYSLSVSVGFMVCIALERYLVIVHPLWYRCRRTIKTSVLICVPAWILPVVFVLTDRFSEDFRVFLVIITIFFLLPLPLLIFFLVATLKALSASISVPTEEKRRIAGILILVLLIYLLLFLPAIVMNVHWYTRNYVQHLYLLRAVGPMILRLSPLADLALYILMRKGIIRQLSACVCRCRKESNEISSVAVNDVNMSAVRGGEREGERAEEV